MKAPKIYRKRGGFTLIELIVVIAILGTLATVGYGPIMDHLNDGDRQVAKDNLGNIYTELVGFTTDNSGRFPSDETAENLQSKLDEDGIDYGPLQGDNSNCYFRQLIANKSEVAEKSFFAKVTGVTAEGDNKKANGKALQAGENAFSYVLRKAKDDGDAKYLSVNLSKSSPIVMTPTKKSARMPVYDGTNVEFDLIPFRGHVFVLFTDKSVKDLRAGKEIKENDDDDSIGTFTDDIFPQTRKGASTAGDYVILGPELK